MTAIVHGKVYQVEILHYRQMNGELVLAGSTAKHMRKNFSCRGGLTVVHLVRNGHVWCLGQAKCSDQDNFNRKLGVRIALNRAVDAATDVYAKVAIK